MRYILTLATLLFATTITPSVVQAQTIITGMVDRVIDGDTFVYSSEARIRLCGIDSPEINKPGGVAAQKFLHNLIVGKQVVCKIVSGGTPCDGKSPVISFNRIVAQCFIGKKDIAVKLVESCHAKDFPKYSGGYYGKIKCKK